MSSDSPQNLEELFEFYYNFVKPLYSEVQTQNALPVETLFELNAAFDHISRIYYYSEPEVKAIDKAYGHLKRSCLDIFKLRVKEARSQFDELRKIDTSFIDEGNFNSELVDLYSAIKDGAKVAREKEGEYKSTGEEEHAFELWQPVLDNCVTLEKEFYNCSNVNWAKQYSTKINRRGFVISVTAAFIGGSLVTVIYNNFFGLISFIERFLGN